MITERYIPRNIHGMTRVEVDASPGVSMVERAIATLRDVMIIIFLMVLLIMGYRFTAALGEISDQLAPAGLTQTDPPLPKDRCGGGIC